MLATVEIPMAILMNFGTGMPMAPVALILDRVGCGKSNMTAYKPEIPESQLSGEIETKFQQLPTFLRSSNRMGLVQLLSDQPGCSKSNMAASKPEIPISKLPRISGNAFYTNGI